MNRLLNRREAADYLNLSAASLASYAVRATGPNYIKSGGVVYYYTEALDEWKKSREEAKTPTPIQIHHMPYPPTAPNTDRAVFSREEAAHYLNVGKTTLERWAREGYGPLPIKLSARRLGYRKEDMDKWVASLQQTSAAIRANIAKLECGVQLDRTYEWSNAAAYLAGRIAQAEEDMQIAAAVGDDLPSPTHVGAFKAAAAIRANIAKLKDEDAK